jgi:hypothetical protein
LIRAGMKFRNKKKFRYGIPAYTGPFQALDTGYRSTPDFTNLETLFIKSDGPHCKRTLTPSCSLVVS